MSPNRKNSDRGIETCNDSPSHSPNERCPNRKNSDRGIETNVSETPLIAPVRPNRKNSDRGIETPDQPSRDRLIHQVRTERIPIEELKHSRFRLLGGDGLRPNRKNSDRGIETTSAWRASSKAPHVRTERIPIEELKLRQHRHDQFTGVRSEPKEFRSRN